MAGSKGSKYYNVFLRYQLNLESNTNEKILSCEGLGLLNAVRKARSLALAAAEMSMSYRKAWGIVNEVEEKLGFALVRKQRGGSEGGFTILTKEGDELIDAYNELTRQFDNSMREITQIFFQSINRKKDE